MKRETNIYHKIYDIDNIRLAHKNARKDKLFYREVKMVDSNPDYFFNIIHDMLKNDKYIVSDYSISIINDKGKERELMKLPYYPDRIIQWAIMLQLEEIFIKNFCNHTCASVKGRGIHYATKLTRSYLKDTTNTQYCLKFDINKFYPSINHNILKTLLKHKFKDKRLLRLLFLIIDSHPKKQGLPIGSYLSQYLSNFYLSYFDHWLKETKKIKYVVRYMDDIIILHSSKQYLHGLKNEIEDYLQSKLNLKLKSNWQIFPTRIRGIDFVGYRHFGDYNLLRKSTVKKFKKKLIKLTKQIELNYSDWCSVNSYYGWLKWCDSYRIIKKYYKPIEDKLLDYYNNKIKRR